MEVVGTKRLNARFREIQNRAPDLARGVMDSTLSLMQDEARRNAPGQTLPRSIQKQVYRQGGELVGELKTNHPAASHMEWGTKPHSITPKNKQALRFVVGGQVLLRKSVQHPGTKAYLFMRQAARVGRVQYFRSMRQVFRTFLQ